MKNRNLFLSILMLVIFFSGCSHINVIFVHRYMNIDNIDKIKNEMLKKRVKEFYYYLKNRDFISMYEMESPSFRYFYDFKLYKGFYSGYKKFDEIKLLEVNRSKKGDFEVLKLLFKKKDGNINSIVYEEWIYVNGDYYHNLFDPFIFNK